MIKLTVRRGRRQNRENIENQTSDGNKDWRIKNEERAIDSARLNLDVESSVGKNIQKQKGTAVKQRSKQDASKNARRCYQLNLDIRRERNKKYRDSNDQSHDQRGGAKIRERSQVSEERKGELSINSTRGRNRTVRSDRTKTRRKKTKRGRKISSVRPDENKKSLRSKD